MPRYLIERKVPNVGQMSDDDLRGISRKSNGVIEEITAEGQRAQWVESYVTDDALYWLYVSPDTNAIREHASRGGFPADRVMEVKHVIGPVTGE